MLSCSCGGECWTEFIVPIFRTYFILDDVITAKLGDVEIDADDALLALRAVINLFVVWRPQRQLQ